jgi:hypothetical protein
MKDMHGNEVKVEDKIRLRDWKGVTIVQSDANGKLRAAVPGFKMMVTLNSKNFTLCN